MNRQARIEAGRRHDPFVFDWDPLFGFWSHQDAAGRIGMVHDFTTEECRRALKVPGLQKTVKTAIERRLKKLEVQS